MDTEEMYRRGIADAEQGEPHPFYYQHYYQYRRGYDQARRRQGLPGGFYDIRRPNGRNELVAVNADRHESDLAPAEQGDVALWQNTASGTSSASDGQTGADTKKPLSLWWYVMLAVLLLAVAESLLGNQHLSVDKEAV